MPLADYSLAVLKNALAACDKDKARLGRVLAFSIPDLVVSDAAIDAILGEGFAATLPVRQDSGGIIVWHKCKRITGHTIRDTTALFRRLGYELVGMDIVAGRGKERIHDLSEPLPPAHHGKYDLVIDIISNQVWDVARVMRSAAEAVRVGGRVMHVIPTSMVNQGFWNVSPVAYRTFYEANGFKLEKHDMVRGVNAKDEDVVVSMDRRARGVQDDVMNLVVALKVKQVRRYVKPIMPKFVKHPLCKKDKAANEET